VSGADGPVSQWRGRDGNPAPGAYYSGVDFAELGYKGLEITGISITPVAFSDPPLLNQVGVHQPYALRAVIEVHTGSGLTGLGETYGDADHLERLGAAARAIIGADVFAQHQVRERAGQALAGAVGRDAHGLTGVVTSGGTVDRVYAPFEVACLDVAGRALGRPVSDLLGGAVRDRVPFSAYLFYKWAGHPGAEPDAWGEALDPPGIVAQARRMIGEYGFSAIKLKGGFFPPDHDVEVIRALHQEFPDLPLRLDPNGAWTPATSVKVGHALTGVLEYLEDPTIGITEMAQVARQVSMPLATNMCVVDFEHVAPAVAEGAVSIILSDLHYWGGLRRSADLARICATFGLGLSMHSNSHLGISLAAMTQLAAATPELTYACDTHWPWKRAGEDVIEPGPLTFRDGAVDVPTTPGLGVELDGDALARLHEQYEKSHIRTRDDTAYMREFDPAFPRVTPRW
jgi:glucarate dehydratase